MLSPHIRRKVRKLWDSFWTAGLTNPLVAIEQITYLLFLKRLEPLDYERVNKGRPSIYEAKGEKCRWSFIKQDSNPEHLRDAVFPWLRKLEKKFGASGTPANGVEAVGERMTDAYFQLDPNKGAILKDAVKLIDNLFERADMAGAATDIMGDTFEHLLDEISTAGKNGQFRTPRHLIRMMVELLDPKPGEKIIDPAVGTGGFLFSAMQHMLMRHTPEENLLLEWNGTPHRAHGESLGSKKYKEVHNGENYIGFDNDRTMVRLGWMNLILHGIENPQIHQRDSLAKHRDDDRLNRLLVSESYDCVFANPPFTGKVDMADLERSIFPVAGKRSKKADQVITNKSELLFIWRMLDLLHVGGRCAVIVPEGVLFGNTEAHVRLRKELLSEHLVEAVISLPGGAFQPYTGVKTSVLVFQKETRKEDRDEWKHVEQPRTRRVWFYEVKDEAFSLDAKRTERRGQNNDLWDVIEKYKKRHDSDADELVYYQPEYHTERWRMVDEVAMNIFSEIPGVINWQGKAASIKELFNLPDDPVKAHEHIEAQEKPKLEKLAMACLNADARTCSEDTKLLKEEIQPAEVAQKQLKNAMASFRRLFNQQKELFDKEDPVAWPIFQKAFQSALESAAMHYTSLIESSGKIKKITYNSDAALYEARRIAREYAKLDGYDVMLRTLESFKAETALNEVRHWTAPVRVYARDDEWKSRNSKIRSSHDEHGQVRSEYVAGVELYDDKGKLIDGILDPDCVEARGWNLSAGQQYKPSISETIESDKSVVEMILELKEKEMKIVEGLDRLMAMVEGQV